MSNVSVGDAIRGRVTEIVTVAPGTSLKEAVKLLADRQIGLLVVTDGDGSLKGVVSERDVIRAVAERGGKALSAKVEEVYTSEVVTCGPEETAHDAITTMNEGKFRHMPVIENGKVTAVVSLSDLVNHVLFEVEFATLQYV